MLCPAEWMTLEEALGCGISRAVLLDDPTLVRDQREEGGETVTYLRRDQVAQLCANLQMNGE